MPFAFLLALVAGLMVGIAWRTWLVVPWPVVWFLLVLTLALAVVWRRKSAEQVGEAGVAGPRAFSAPPLLLLILFLIAVSLGVVRTEIATWQFGHSPLATQVGKTTTLEGVVVSEPDRREKSTQLHVRVGEDRVLVMVDRLEAVAYGDRLLVTGKLEKPTTFTTDLGRTFNYPGYLLARGIEFRISFAKVEVINSGEGNLILATLLSAKQQFLDSTEKIIPEPAVALGSGLLLGVQSALGEDIEQDFRQTGIIHIVVLSGYNVMLVVAFIMFCFSFFLPLRLRVVAGIIAIVSFALVVGLSATVVRASIMAGLVLLAQALHRQSEVLRLLFIAGAIMVLINPYLLVYDIGFQLSFMATLGLVLLVPRFETAVLEKFKLFGIKDFLLATIATQIAVLPLLMYHIGEVSLIAILANVLVLPMVPVAMLLTFVVGLMGFVWPALAYFIGYLATLSLEYILTVARLLADFPLASVTLPIFPAGSVLFAYSLLGVLLYWLTVRPKPTDNLLAGWTIELEDNQTPGADQAEKRPETALSDPKKLPIFFR